MKEERLPPFVEFVLQEEEPEQKHAKEKPAPATKPEAGPAAASDQPAPHVPDDESSAFEDEPTPDVPDDEHEPATVDDEPATVDDEHELATVDDEPTEANSVAALLGEDCSWETLAALGYSADELVVDEACDPDLLELDAEFVTQEPVT